MEITFEAVTPTRVETEIGVYIVTPSYDSKLKTITVSIANKIEESEGEETITTSESVGWIKYYATSKKILGASLSLHENISSLMSEVKEIVESAADQLSN